MVVILTRNMKSLLKIHVYASICELFQGKDLIEQMETKLWRIQRRKVMKMDRLKTISIKKLSKMEIGTSFKSWKKMCKQRARRVSMGSTVIRSFVQRNWIVVWVIFPSDHYLCLNIQNQYFLQSDIIEYLILISYNSWLHIFQTCSIAMIFQTRAWFP